MSHWIFKVSEQDLYPDKHGRTYVYDNTHSTRVRHGDAFLYLDKRNKRYCFSALGAVKRISSRTAKGKEIRNPRVSRVFTVHLSDVTWLDPVLDVAPGTEQGRQNRSRLGIKDVNRLGWSHSMPRLDETMFDSLIELATLQGSLDTTNLPEHDFTIEDNFTYAKKRAISCAFRVAVMTRHEKSCVLCGTSLEEMLDAAHISPYATDKRNRANPANGLCLCAFCHRAFDRGLVAIHPDGHLWVSHTVDSDATFHAHISGMDAAERRKRLKGVDVEILLGSYSAASERSTVK